VKITLLSLDGHRVRCAVRTAFASARDTSDSHVDRLGRIFRFAPAGRLLEPAGGGGSAVGKSRSPAPPTFRTLSL
jgi:hypothetical protein